MPMYEYECPMQHRTVVVRKIAARHDPLTCECGRLMSLVISQSHCPPDGVYSYAPNIGDPNRFERQRAAMHAGQKVIPRTPDRPLESRDGQLTPKRND